MQFIEDILGGYDLAHISEISLIQAGAENTNYLVETDEDDYVLRLYNLKHSLRGKRSKQSIEHELDFMEAAHSTGLATPQIVRNINSERITEATIENTERYLALYPYINGTTLDAYSAGTVKQVGTILDRLFDAGQVFQDGDFDMRYGVLNQASLKYTRLSETGITIPRKMREFWQTVTSTQKDIPLDKLSKGLVHGDVKPGNLLFDDDYQLAAVLDFDDYRYSYLLEDVAMALMHELHSPEENMLRSGYYEHLIAAIQHPQLLKELEYLRYFLQVRLVLDVSNYLRRGYTDLVEELLNDPRIEKYIL